jgi:hypothetical protein
MAQGHGLESHGPLEVIFLVDALGLCKDSRKQISSLRTWTCLL